MMMRSPYRGRYAPEYYSAAEVQRAIEQLKYAANTWQQRYEASQAANERLHHKLSQLQNTVAENARVHNEVERLEAEVAAWREKYEALQAEVERQEAEAKTTDVSEPEGDIETFILDVLPFLDNLERALHHAGEHPLSTGIALTLKEFANIIARYGIQRISPEGQPFDPTVHEALGAVSHPTLPAGSVAVVEQAGYKHGTRLLRPARVMVVADDGEPR